MESVHRTWPPILGLALAAALGFACTRALGLPALAMGFVLLGLEVPVARRPRSRGLAAWRRCSAPLLGLGFFLGAQGALEQDWQYARSGQPRADVGLVRFSGKTLENARDSGFGQVEARIQVGGEVLTLCMERRDLTRGSRIRGIARLDRQAGRGYLHTRPALIEIHEGPRERLRHRLRDRLDASLRTWLDPRVALLVHRLLLGRKGELGAEIERDHRRLGLSHLLAISGMHTLFLAVFLTRLLRPITSILGGELRLLVPLLLGYAWLTGGQPPVLGAVLGYLFWRFCWARGLGFDIGACLGFAAIVVLAAIPEDFASLSFLLSFSATLALVCLLAPIRDWWRRHRVTPSIATLLAASMAAQLGTATLSLEAFGHLAPWGILATPLLLPLLFVLLSLGLLFFLALPFGVLQSPIAALLDLTGRTWLMLVHAVPPLPGAPLRPLFLPPPGLTLALLLGLAVVALWMQSRRWLLAAWLLPAMLWFVPLRYSRTSSLALLPIGHGLCSVMEQAGRVLVFDCGDQRDGRRAARALLAELRQRGPARIDDLVLSHADRDHSSALPELLLRLRIGRVWLPESPKAAWIQRMLHRERCEVHVLVPGARATPGTGTLILAPHDGGDLAGSNDGGLVLYRRFEDGPDLLLTGDQEEAGTAALLRTPHLPARIDILVLPHHGSRGSRFDRLVRRFRPRFCLASTGARTFIDRGILDAVAPDLPLLTTGRSGAIRAASAGRGTWYLSSDRGLELRRLPR